MAGVVYVRRVFMRERRPEEYRDKGLRETSREEDRKRRDVWLGGGKDVV